MRIAAISDIHGNVLALKAVLADIERANVDLTVNLGDILSGPLWPAETADFLIPLDFPTICGNHERQLLTQNEDQMSSSDRITSGLITKRHREWLADLPETRQLSHDVFLCHGTPDSDLVYFLEDFEGTSVVAANAGIVLNRMGNCKTAMVLCGHTHIQRYIQLETGQMVVNPGSVGLPAYEDNVPKYHRMESQSPHARYAIVSQGSDLSWSVDMRQIRYDWETAAKMAEQHSRVDWATALRTGFC